MQLYGSLMDRNRYHEHLADVDVTSDLSEKWGADDDSIRRLVEGTIRRMGPMWKDYTGFWFSPFMNPIELNGHSYRMVTLLQVDHDLYPQRSWMNVEGATVRLILLEHFFGSLEEYRNELRERSERVQKYLDRVERGNLTANDLREKMGLPSEPRFNTPIAPEALDQAKKDLLGEDNKLIRNILC